MSLWAIVPIKPIRNAKSRLASVLREEERVTLSREMLRHVLQTLGEVDRIGRVLLVSRDTEALALGRRHGARTLSERPPIDLNQALDQATRAAIGSGASAVLVVPADLPLVSPDDIEALIALSEPPPSLVLAPDRARLGTNAFLATPPGLIEYQFGPDSLSRHRAAALAASIRVAECDRPGLALDLDLPEDLDRYREASGGRAA